jgi:hypothetical protein
MLFFYKDPAYAKGIYTYDNIPPSAFSQFKVINGINET